MSNPTAANLPMLTTLAQAAPAIDAPSAPAAPLGPALPDLPAGDALSNAQQRIDQLTTQLPADSLTIVLGIALLLGFMLWLFGGRLIKAGGAITGGILASSLALILLRPYLDGVMLLGASAVAGAAGATLAVLLMRFWMAASLAVVFALAAPIVTLMWNQTPAPQTPSSDELRQTITDNTDAPPADWSDAQQRIDDWLDLQQQRITDWWDSLGARIHAMLLTGVAIGILAGLSIGFVMPNLAAALQSALIGSILMVASGIGLARDHLSPAFSEHLDDPRVRLIAVGLITILGALVQWTIRRPKADK